MGCTNGRLEASSPTTKVKIIHLHGLLQSWQLLHDSILENNYSRCYRLLECFQNVDQLHSDALALSGSTVSELSAVSGTLFLPPLHLACMFYRSEIIRLLLNNGSSVSSLDNNGRTPIVLTILYWPKVGLWSRPKECFLSEAERRFWERIAEHHDRSMKCLLLLLTNNANPSDLANKEEATLLHVCAKRELINAMTVLIKHDAKLEIRDIHGYTPLLCAARNGRGRSVEQLLIQGANWQTTDNNGYNLLHYLCFNEGISKEEVEALLCDFSILLKLINQTANHGQTPLHLSAQKGNGDKINLLLTKGANPDLQDCFGRTPLYMLLKHNDVGFVLTGLFSLLTETSVMTMKDKRGKLPEKLTQSKLKAFKKALIRRSVTPFKLYDMCFKKVYRLLGSGRVESSVVISLPCPHFIKKDIIAYRFVCRNYWERKVFDN